MRNGNRLPTRSSRVVFSFRSYRTYEEWKLSSTASPRCTSTRSYRTYEEWKPAEEANQTQEQKSSYRTYEEWKHFTFVPDWVSVLFVLTVPMRNGNRSFLKNTRRNLKVLTVPMRNGNPVCFQDVDVELWEFLPYLWGMETCPRSY